MNKFQLPFAQLVLPPVSEPTGLEGWYDSNSFTLSRQKFRTRNFKTGEHQAIKCTVLVCVASWMSDRSLYHHNFRKPSDDG